jgi:5-methylcytosine-specific restriction endonuclease McrA
VEKAPLGILARQKLRCYNWIMKNDPRSLASLTDEQLLLKVKALAALEREATGQLIASLAELDARRLYLAEGFSSLFSYCTEALHLSEHAAYNRIEVARAARQWPLILQMIADGAVTLTAVRLLGPSLTEDNHRELLDLATHKSKRQVEQIVAALHPQPPVPSIVRKVLAPGPAAPPTAELSCSESPTLGPLTSSTSHYRFRPAPTACSNQRPAVIAPLAPERYKVQMTVSRETHDKLRRVQDLLRHQVPDGDPSVVFDRALTLLLHDLERKKLADAKRPRPARGATPGSRHVPAAVKREVWRRDQGQCAFVGDSRRCAERGFLEFHHVIPFAGGGPTTVENLQLRCRAHNVYEAEQHFGPMFVREEPRTYSSFRNELALA